MENIYLSSNSGYGVGTGTGTATVSIKNIKFVSSTQWVLADPFTSNMQQYFAAIIFNPTNDPGKNPTNEQINSISNLTFKIDTPFSLKIRKLKASQYKLYVSFNLIPISSETASDVLNMATAFLSLFGPSPPAPPAGENPLQTIQIPGSPDWLSDLTSSIVPLYSPSSNDPSYNPGGNEMPCLLTGTKVNTPRGWTNIEDIKVGDTVYNHDMDAVPIIKTHNWDIQWGSKHFGETVYKIAKNTYGATEDIYISAHHKILINDVEMVETYQLGLPKALKSEITINDVYTLHHIQMENHHINNFIVNGSCIVESWDGVLTINDRVAENAAFKNFMNLILKDVFGVQ